MLRQRAAAHYRAQGYDVHEDVRVRGESGTVHACEMVVEGSLGYLVVGFPDDGGFVGPEMGGLRRTARDVGGTPVVVADEFTPEARNMATQLGVVLLPASDLPESVPEPEGPTPWPSTEQDLEPEAEDAGQMHWPGSGRREPSLERPAHARDVDELVEEWTEQAVTGAAGRGAGAQLWRYPRGEVAEPVTRRREHRGPEPARTSAPAREPADADETKPFGWLASAGPGADAPTHETHEPTGGRPTQKPGLTQEDRSAILETVRSFEGPLRRHPRDDAAAHEAGLAAAHSTPSPAPGPPRRALAGGPARAAGDDARAARRGADGGVQHALTPSGARAHAAPVGAAAFDRPSALARLSRAEWTQAVLFGLVTAVLFFLLAVLFL